MKILPPPQKKNKNRLLYHKFKLMNKQIITATCNDTIERYHVGDIWGEWKSR